MSQRGHVAPEFSTITLDGNSGLMKYKRGKKRLLLGNKQARTLSVTQRTLLY